MADNRSAGVTAISELASSTYEKCINSPNDWTNWVKSDNPISTDMVWYLFRAIATKFNNKGYTAVYVGANNPSDDPNYDNYHDWVEACSKELKLNPKEYWYNIEQRKDNDGGFNPEYVAVLFIRFRDSMHKAIFGESANKARGGAYISAERTFLLQEGLINSYEDDYLANYAGNGVEADDTDLIRELFNRFGRVLGSGTDTYNSNIYFHQAKGIIDDTGYWAEMQTGNAGETFGPGVMLSQGWADGGKVAKFIKNFIHRYKVDVLNYTVSASGEPVKPENEIDFDIKEIHKDLGIYIPTLQDEKEFTYYNRWKTAEYIDRATNGRAYIFITKPKCNFSSENLASQRYFANLAATIKGKNIMTNLTYGTSDTDPIPSSPPGIIRLLTNKATNFDCQDVTLNQDITVSTIKNYKYSLPGSEASSVTNGSFTITYEEDQYLSVTLMHKAWVDYITNVRYGYFKPSEISLKQRYIDYVASLYYFLVGEDGCTIKYFAKYTGIYPINVPYSALSWNKGTANMINVPIQYAFSFKEDMEPTIIKEFNTIFGSYNTNPDTIAEEYNQYMSGNLDKNPKNTWKNSVGIYRVFPKGDGTTIKRWIDEDGNSKMYFDGTAKLLFYDKSY